MGSRTPAPIDLTSYYGQPVLVSATATLGQLVYSVVAAGAQWERVRVLAWHNDIAVDHTLTMEVTDTDGATVLGTLSREFGATENYIEFIAGWKLRQPCELRFYADTTNIVYVKPEFELELPIA